MFRIANKQAVTVDFILNDVQYQYSVAATSRDIILKARREGFSSYIRGEFLGACLTEENTRAVILSQDTEATMKHLAAVKFYIKHMKGLQPQIGYNSRNEITFPKMDSTFYIGTAGSKTFGRGDTITHLHMSEAAFYDDLKGLQGSIMEAAAHAKRIVLESTANGYNFFQKMCQKARQHDGSYTLHFFPWYADESNYLPLFAGEQLPLLDEDIERMERHHLTMEQMKWYITKRADFMEHPNDVEGKLLFQQEYPTSIEEAFKSSGANFFRTIPYEALEPIDRQGHTFIYRPAIPGRRYVIGVDYSGGIGQDYGVVTVLCTDPLEQVACYRDCWTEPEQLSYKAAELGRVYNMAYIVPEANNHGTLGVDVLKRIYPQSHIYKRDIPVRKGVNGPKKKTMLGYLTTEASKPYMCNALSLYLRRGLKIYDAEAYSELQVFMEDEGRLRAPEGMFDDCVMSMALAAVGIRKLIPELPKAPVISPPPPQGVIYPFDNAKDALDIVLNTRRGRELIKRFYMHPSSVLSEMSRLNYGRASKHPTAK